jgi:hypothetical protein
VLPDLKQMPPLMKGGAIALPVLVGLAAWLGWRQCQVNATPPPTEVPVPPPPVVETLDGGLAPAPVVEKTTATIVFSTVPPAHATVSWGKKRLGVLAPGKSLTVVRPRDSGPLDVIVRAEGFLPVHTRAHTFSDNRVAVKLTRPTETTTLLGYRVPIDAGLPLEEAPSIDPAATEPMLLP